MKRLLLGLTFSLALSLALAVAAGAQAAPSAKVVRQVHVLLNAPEHVPSADEWKRLGPDAAEVLRKVATDEDVLMLKRGRAAVALVYFKSDASKATLTSLVASDEAHWLLRGKAARALAFSYQAESLPAIEPLLRHDKKRMREAAIKAVGLVDADASRSLLKSRLEAEKDGYLRKLIDSTLKRLAEKGGK